MKKEHAVEVSHLHYKHVPGLLREFGIRTCLAFYKTSLKSKKNIGFVYLENNRVEGFVFGTEDSRSLFRNWSIYIQMLIAIIQHPRLLISIKERLSHKRPHGPESCYVAVSKKFRGQSLGKKLLSRSYQEFKNRGYTKVMGWIDEDVKENMSIHLKIGAKIVGQFSENGKKKYIIEIPTGTFFSNH